MRLSHHDCTAMMQITAAVVCPAAHALLFDPGVRQVLHGDDIDQLIELPAAVTESVRLTGRLGASIERAVSPCGVEVPIADPQTHASPVLMAARRGGVAL